MFLTSESSSLSSIPSKYSKGLIFHVNAAKTSFSSLELGFCGVGVNFNHFPKILCSVSVKARLDRLTSMSLSKCVCYMLRFYDVYM